MQYESGSKKEKKKRNATEGKERGSLWRWSARTGVSSQDKKSHRAKSFIRRRRLAAFFLLRCVAVRLFDRASAR